MARSALATYLKNVYRGMGAVLRAADQSGVANTTTVVDGINRTGIEPSMDLGWSRPLQCSPHCISRCVSHCWLRMSSDIILPPDSGCAGQGTASLHASIPGLIIDVRDPDASSTPSSARSGTRRSASRALESSSRVSSTCYDCPLSAARICFSFASQTAHCTRRLFRPSAATAPCALPVPGDLIDSGLHQSPVPSVSIGSGSPFCCGSPCDGPARVWPSRRETICISQTRLTPSPD